MIMLLWLFWICHALLELVSTLNLLIACIKRRTPMLYLSNLMPCCPSLDSSAYDRPCLTIEVGITCCLIVRVDRE